MFSGVEPWTRRRVLLDTTPQRLGRFLALSVALHLPLSPLAGLLGLVRFLGQEPDVPSLPPVTEIPLDFIEDDAASDKQPADAPKGEDAAPASGGPEAAPTAPEPELPKPKPKPKPKPPVDAGAGGAGSDEPGERDAGKPGAGGASQDAGTERDQAPKHRPGEGIGDPVAGVGDKRVVDPNANVRVMVYNDRVRRHPLGARVGPLLRGVYQWRDFFGPTAIDPVHDIDRMMLVGPQLRDSRDVVAILQFNLPQARVRDAVDVLVARDPEGGWVEGPVPVAKAHADRGERAFVFPSPQILVVTPPSAQASAEKLPKKFRLPAPKGEEIALAKLATPWRAFRGLPIAIPKTISAAELRLSPGIDGGVVIDVLAHDESEAQAVSSARTLTSGLELGLGGLVLIGTAQLKGHFEADGADVRGEIALSRRELLGLLNFASGFLGAGTPAPRPPSSAAPTATPAPSPKTD